MLTSGSNWWMRNRFEPVLITLLTSALISLYVLVWQVRWWPSPWLRKTCTEEKVKQELKPRLKFHKCPVLCLTHAFRRSDTFNTDRNAAHRPPILHSAGSWEDSSPSQLTWRGGWGGGVHPGLVATSSRGMRYTDTHSGHHVDCVCRGCAVKPQNLQRDYEDI